MLSPVDKASSREEHLGTIRRTSGFGCSRNSSRTELCLPVLLFHFSPYFPGTWVGELIGEMRKTIRHAESIGFHSYACQIFISLDKLISTFYSTITALLPLIMCCVTLDVLTAI